MQDNLAELLPAVFRYAFQLCHDQHLAEDLAQEATLRAIKAGVDGHEIVRLRVWLFRTTRNLFIDGFRHNASFKTHTLNPIANPSKAQQTALEKLGQHEDVERAMQLVAELPERQKTMVHLIAVEEFSIQQAAEVMGISPQTARSHLSQARATLRQRFQQLHTKTVTE